MIKVDIVGRENRHTAYYWYFLKATTLSGYLNRLIYENVVFDKNQIVHWGRQEKTQTSEPFFSAMVLIFGQKLNASGTNDKDFVPYRFVED